MERRDDKGSSGYNGDGKKRITAQKVPDDTLHDL